ncbi:MAG: biotin/lipoyl-binding protein [Myxococcales bacterium]|nr:biotin/lipoyl-binding protein [Myxococcales bacterium]
MRYFVTIEGEEHVMDVVKLPSGGFEVRPVRLAEGGGEELLAPIPAELSSTGGLSTVHLDGQVFDLVIDGEMPGEVDAYANGRRATVRVETERSRAAASVRGAKAGSADGTIKSPMPGKVVKVLVTEGQEVAAGSPVVVVEAMKMENELVAEGPGTVKKVFVQPGDAVEGGAKLVTIA